MSYSVKISYIKTWRYISCVYIKLNIIDGAIKPLIQWRFTTNTYQGLQAESSRSRRWGPCSWRGQLHRMGDWNLRSSSHHGCIPAQATLVSFHPLKQKIGIKYCFLDLEVGQVTNKMFQIELFGINSRSN